MKNVFLTLCALFSFASVSNAAVVHLTISKVRNNNGQLMVAVFGKNEYAKKKDAIVINGKQVRFLLPANGARTVDIELPVGEYSIGIVHDENMNNKMDRILGMGPPSEGGGFTGGMGYTGPKSWDESKVTVPAAGLNVNVDLRYWN